MALQTYSEDEARAKLVEILPQWIVDGGFLSRRYRTQGWKGTLMVINTVGHLAEAAWHHPDIAASYAHVDVRLQTHDAGGITDKDFELARKIEQVVMWRPYLENSSLEGTPQTKAHRYIKYDE